MLEIIQRTIYFLLVENWSITLVMVLGLAGTYFLLPRPRAYPLLWGAGLGVLALVAGVFLLLGTKQLDPEPLLFYLFSGVAILAGALLVTQRNPARAALSFALVVLSTCGLFLLQAAPFLMAATTIIYAGAIVVTFLFVIMLAQQEGPSDADQRSREPLFSAAAGFLLLGTLLYVLKLSYGTGELDGFLQRARRIDEKAEKLKERAEANLDRANLKGLLNEVDDVLNRLEKRDNVADLPTGLLPDLKSWHDKNQRGSEEDAENALNRAVDSLANNRRLLRLRGQIKRDEPVDPDDLSKALGELKDGLFNLVVAGEQARNNLGVLQPHSNEPMSPLSGPAANEPLDKIRRDPPRQGMPQMPAENVAYLGRSLFSDYLLAVELGGTLLLVATIGAIAIAHAGRRNV